MKKKDLESLWEQYPMRKYEANKRGLIDLSHKAKEILKKDINVIVEIGSFAGESMFLFCETLRPKVFISVDPYLNGFDENDAANFQDMCKTENTFNTVLSYVREYFDTNVIKVRGTSIELIRILNELNIKVDMFYIDGCHTYDKVVEDLKNINNYNNSCPYILSGHDYDLEDIKRALAFMKISEDDIYKFKDDSWLCKELKI